MRYHFWHTKVKCFVSVGTILGVGEVVVNETNTQ